MCIGDAIQMIDAKRIKLLYEKVYTNVNDDEIEMLAKEFGSRQEALPNSSFFKLISGSLFLFFLVFRFIFLFLLINIFSSFSPQ